MYHVQISKDNSDHKSLNNLIYYYERIELIL